MRQTVTVLSCNGSYATVGYDRPTACHGDCDHCAGGCGSTVAKEHIVVQAENIIGAAPGDRVVIEASTGTVFSAIALVYAIPLILFFCGYFAGEALIGSGALWGVLGFFLGLGLAVLSSRRRTKTGREITFRIVAYGES